VCVVTCMWNTNSKKKNAWRHILQKNGRCASLYPPREQCNFPPNRAAVCPSAATGDFGDGDGCEEGDEGDEVEEEGEEPADDGDGDVVQEVRVTYYRLPQLNQTININLFLTV
jgi:hypothetical protein